MRLLTFPILTVLAGSLAWAAGGPKDFTYLSGSLDDLAQSIGGKLSYSDASKLELKTPLHSVVIPYTAISSVELGEVHTPAPEPVYKVWSLHKRFANKNETQELTVAFKDDAGRDQTATLELAKQDAADVLAVIQDRNEHLQGGFTSRSTQDWWGDQLWKTARNTNQWHRD